jgi:glutathione peroxidase
MRRRDILIGILALPFGAPAFSAASAADFTFPSIDGCTIDLADLRGGPVLVVNTASRCGFTVQYDGLQALYDRYRNRGLTVLGVPSNTFRQELSDAESVKEFCEVNFAIDFPMTGLLDVRGSAAHPFYRWAASQGVEPAWNFHKILLDPDGATAASFGAQITSLSSQVTGAVEALLPRA